MVSLDVNRKVCETKDFWTNDNLEYISLLALVLAFFHCVSTVNYFIKLASQLEKLQKLYDKRMESQMTNAQIIKRNEAKVPEQRLLDNYAKIDKFNTEFKLKESGVEVLMPSERYTSIAELQQTKVMQKRLGDSGPAQAQTQSSNWKQASELFELDTANSDFSDLSISTLSGEEMNEAELHRL